MLGLGTGSVNEAGSILVTFGSPIWALFKILKTISTTNVVSNTFIVASNNSPATISVGEERRIASSKAYNTTSDKNYTIGKTAVSSG